MTATFGTITEYMLDSKASRAAERAKALEELKRMSAAMVEQEGLLNYPQAATVLGVSTKRVSELVSRGKLSRFDFAGRTYVSVKEITKRYEEEIAAGERVRQSASQRLITATKAVLQTDKHQWNHTANEVRADRAKQKQQDKEKRSEFLKKLVDPMEPPKKKGKK